MAKKKCVFTYIGATWFLWPLYLMIQSVRADKGSINHFNLWLAQLLLRSTMVLRLLTVFRKNGYWSCKDDSSWRF
jgi:hypothetical protein